MKKTILKLKVYGGIPPFSIKIILFKGNDVVDEFEKKDGFEYSFDKLKGNYNLMISGPNPMSDQRRTVISLDVSEIKLAKDADANPCERVGKSYLVQYPFTA